jgi:hypothetical protein
MSLRINQNISAVMQKDLDIAKKTDASAVQKNITAARTGDNFAISRTTRALGVITNFLDRSQQAVNSTLEQSAEKGIKTRDMQNLNRDLNAIEGSVQAMQRGEPLVQETQNVNPLEDNLYCPNENCDCNCDPDELCPPVNLCPPDPVPVSVTTAERQNTIQPQDNFPFPPEGGGNPLEQQNRVLTAQPQDNFPFPPEGGGNPLEQQNRVLTAQPQDNFPFPPKGGGNLLEQQNRVLTAQPQDNFPFPPKGGGNLLEQQNKIGTLQPLDNFPYPPDNEGSPLANTQDLRLVQDRLSKIRSQLDSTLSRASQPAIGGAYANPAQISLRLLE